MENLTASPRPSAANLAPGQIVKAGYIRHGRDFSNANEFINFKVGGQEFTSLKQLKAHFGVSSLK